MILHHFSSHERSAGQVQPQHIEASAVHKSAMSVMRKEAERHEQEEEVE